MVCNQCGSENKIGDKFCKNCGAPLQEATSEFKKQANIKTKPIMILILVIIVLIVLFIGREVPSLIKKMQPNTVTIGNYSMKIPGNYETAVDNNVLTLRLDRFSSEEAVGIQLYPDSYDNVLFNFQLLQDSSEMIIDIEQTEYEDIDWIIANYQMENYRGVVAIKKAGDDKVFWVQSMTTTYKRGKELVEGVIPFVNDATEVKSTTKQKDTTTSIVSRLIEMTE